ncbi:E3 ubiquitin-protein ligase ZNRF2-like [Ornithorhynchus anatinus]|uniref:E3 ubiquitin-protein ligase ZNRF2-like n=1 Tax=Ornithorhynchus anatinus TaxID=9258 RepID=UPI0010A7F16E|nr:E3 ubiquitin-protein ligase ZNRF2-like [Ornithorhynchus anatinus]
MWSAGRRAGRVADVSGRDLAAKTLNGKAGMGGKHGAGRRRQAAGPAAPGAATPLAAATAAAAAASSATSPATSFAAAEQAETAATPGGESGWTCVKTCHPTAASGSFSTVFPPHISPSALPHHPINLCDFFFSFLTPPPQRKNKLNPSQVA